jgi:hypothetical protein
MIDIFILIEKSVFRLFLDNGYHFLKGGIVRFNGYFFGLRISAAKALHMPISKKATIHFIVKNTSLDGNFNKIRNLFIYCVFLIELYITIPIVCRHGGTVID